MIRHIVQVLLIIILNISLSAGWCLKSTLHQLSSQINQIDWSPNNKYIVVASNSKRVTVYSTYTFNVVWFQNFSTAVTTAKFSKSGKWLGVGLSNSDTISIYNVPSFSLNITFRANHQTAGTTIWELDFNKNDDKIVTCGSDGHVNQIRTNTGAREWTKSMTNNKNAFSCQYASTNRIGVACDDGKLYLLKTDGNTDRQTALNYCKDIDFRPDTNQKYIYGGCTCSSIIYQFDTQSANAGNIIPYFTTINQIWAVSYARDSSFLAAGGLDGHFFIIDTKNRLSPFLQDYFKQPVNINTIRVSDDNNKVAVGRVDGKISIYQKICSTCPLGTYSNGTCRLCSFDIVGCFTCKNSTLCYACLTGYYLNSLDTCTMCRDALVGCTNCKTDTICISCAPTYYLVGNQCKKCSGISPLCQQCLSNGTCVVCHYQSFLTPLKTCSLCNNSISNCRECYLEYNASSTTNSTLYCRQCTNGYYANLNKCLPCSSNCINCVSTGVCFACAQEYRLSGTTCIKCSTDCQSCLENGTCLQCRLSSFLSAGSCTACSNPCSSCTSSTVCTSCVMGYYLPASSTTCSKCVGCIICHPTTGVCLSCPVGQFLNTSTNLCINCLNTTSDCAICDMSGCLACQRNYQLTTTKTCILSTSINKCMIYKKNSTVQCQHCLLGYYLSSGVCNLCSKACAICQTESTCKQCHIGYYLQTSNQSCIKCYNNCTTCSSSTVCLSCSDQFYLSGTTCNLCSNQIPHCSSCLNSTNCLNCRLGYTLATNSLSCIQCSSPCASCNSSGCLSCQQGYFYQSNTCTRCPQKCSSCSSSTVCSACVIGFALNSTSSCYSCQLLFPNCYTCSRSICIVCRQNYLLNANTGLCEKCEINIVNCLICNANGCQRCNPGYYTSTDKQSCPSCTTPIPFCQRCTNSSYCQQCMTGFYLNSSNKCSKCMDGCFVCNNGTTCSKCDGSYILSSGTCVQCNSLHAGCSLCKIATGCYQCKVGFYLVNSNNCTLCKNAIQGCAVCSSNVACISCDSGYFLNSSSRCQLCSSTRGCALCDQGSGICRECIYGYFIDSSFVCSLCSNLYQGCQVCNSSSCVKCGSGYYKESGICKSCKNLSESCILCNQTKCLQCQSGFYLSALGLCQECTISGCQICSSNGSTCIACQNLYYKSGNRCELCQTFNFGCLNCFSFNNCAACKSGYYLAVNGSCILCQKKFQACLSCSINKCEACDSNYFQNISSVQKECISCKKSLTGCSMCLDSSTCNLCESGYYLQANNCISCTNISYCLFCANNSTCIRCQSQFYLKNGQCLSCSAAILGCFNCISQNLCLSCSGSYVMSGGICVETKGIPPKQYQQVKIVTQYLNNSHLKHTFYVIRQNFVKIDLEFKIFAVLQLNYPPNNKQRLEILQASWGSKSNHIIFYTNNPLFEFLDERIDAMPFIKNFGKARLLFEFGHLNMKTSFQLNRQVIKQILPTLDTNRQNLVLQYSLNNAQFYRSIVEKQKHHFYIIGVVVTAVFILLYLVKICFLIPGTTDAGQVIPHILIIKACAMVIYPNFGAYMDFCTGFKYIDLPWLNKFFSESFSNLSDYSPSSFKLFYNNLNIASTYLLALFVFCLIYTPLAIYIQCKEKKESKKAYQLQDDQNSISKQNMKRIENLKDLIYNTFLCGLTFSSFANIIGIFYNPYTAITVEGVTYILGTLIYLIILTDGVLRVIISDNKLFRIRVIIKTSLMVLLSWSPIPLFAGMAVIDLILAISQFKMNTKRFVVPKIWLLIQILCIVTYSCLIFLSNMLLGIIIASICLFSILGLDVYAVYCQHLQYEKIKYMQQQPIKENPELFVQKLHIQKYIPKRKELMCQNQVQSKQVNKDINNLQEENINRRKRPRKRKEFKAFDSQNLSNYYSTTYHRLGLQSTQTQYNQQSKPNQISQQNIKLNAQKRAMSLQLQYSQQ